MTQRQRILEVLRAIQWNGHHDGQSVCPYCLTPQDFQPPLRHTCAMAQLLAELAADDAEHEYVRAQSRTPCDCHDCDGRWCTWCFEHHGRKPCPVVEAWSSEPRLVRGSRPDAEEGA